MDNLEWMESDARLDRIRLGTQVEPTMAAPERFYGKTGRVRWIRQTEPWQVGGIIKDRPAVLVCWTLGRDANGRIIDYTCKHRLTEIKLPDEVWDEDEHFPLPPAVPEPDAEQMKMEV